MFKFLSTEKDDSIMKYIWILIIYCAINTLAVYLFQFIQLDIIKEWYLESIYSSLPIWMATNLPALGLEAYETGVALKFLPHYGSNLLSVVLYWECKRILELQEKAKTELKALKDNKAAVPEKVKLEVPYKTYYFLRILIVICKSYWLCIFLSLCAIILTYQLSMTMLIYVFMFCLSFILMFREMIDMVNKFQEKKTNFFFSSMLRYYTVEKRKHIQIQESFRKKTFKYLVMSSMIYILLIYLYSIFDIIQRSVTQESLASDETENIIKSICYLLGIYNKIEEGTVFVYSIWGHMFLAVLISFDLYVQKLQNVLLEKINWIKKLIKLKEKLENSETKDKSKRPSKIAGDKDSISATDSNVTPKQDVSADSKYIVRTNSSITISVTHSVLDEYSDDPLLQKFFKVFKKMQLGKNHTRALNPSDTKFSLQQASKKILEEVIFFNLLLSAIVKLNIISIIYLCYVYFFYVRGKSIYRIYLTTIFLCVMITLQLVVFISNINIDTDPHKSIEMLELIRNDLGLPWYKNHFNDGWAFYLSLGINSYQLTTLWAEFCVLIFCFFYLDNYCYSLYNNDHTEISYSGLGSCGSVRKALEKISEKEYIDIRENLKFNYKIDLVYFSHLPHLLNLQKVSEGKLARLPNRKFQDENLIKKSKAIMFLQSLKKFIYLSFHNYILILILILSMMNPGLISTVYIVFSLIFLYKSNNVLVGGRYELLTASSYFLQGYLFFDLLLQLVYQSPINSYLNAEDILSSLGINIILDYINPKYKINFVINSNFMILACLKVITFFLLSLLMIMYNSKSFKEYYIKYLLFKKSKVLRNGVINAFQFNNKRIQSMQDTVNYRAEITDSLTDLEKQLENWEKKFNQDRNFREDDDTIEVSNTFNEEMSESEVRDKIKLKIKERPLISLAIYLNKVTSSYTFVVAKDREEYENAIITGGTYIKCKIEKKVDEFVDKLDLKQLTPDKVETYIANFNKNERMTLYYNENDLEENNNKDLEEEPLQEEDKNRLKDFDIDDEAMMKIEEEMAPYPKIDSEKYKKLINGKLPSKYLSNMFLIFKIISYFFKYFHNNFELIVYFFMILNNMMNGSLISIAYPLMVFCYGLLSYPRCKNTFWKMIFLYSSAVILLKFIIQLDLLKYIFEDLYLKNNKDKYRLGVRIFDSAFSMEFVFYIIWDCIVLLTVMSKTYILIDKGLWTKIETEIETLEQAHDRIFKAKVIPESKLKAHKESVIKSLANIITTKDELSFKERLDLYFKELFPQTRVNLF
jgi:hypothetical protein